MLMRLSFVSRLQNYHGLSVIVLVGHFVLPRPHIKPEQKKKDPEVGGGGGEL